MVLMFIERWELVSGCEDCGVVCHLEGLAWRVWRNSRDMEVPFRECTEIGWGGGGGGRGGREREREKECKMNRVLCLFLVHYVCSGQILVMYMFIYWNCCMHLFAWLMVVGPKPFCVLHVLIHFWFLGTFFVCLLFLVWHSALAARDHVP